MKYKMISIAFSLYFVVSLSAQTKQTIKMANIPAGSFIMGSPVNEKCRKEDETQHKVVLKSFKMSKYEITNRQFKEFLDSTGYVLDDTKTGQWHTIEEFIKEERPDGSVVLTLPTDKELMKESINKKWNQIPEAEQNLPVTNISWNDANAYAVWNGCRLPTEAEWEYACRAGKATPFFTGLNITTDQANYDGNFPYNNNPKGKNRGKVTLVGSFAPNAWGLYDMHGNVWEWCSDYYGEYVTSPQNNPTGPISGTLKVIRGGSWNFDAQYCRSANRSYLEPNKRGNIGFRIVSDK